MKFEFKHHGSGTDPAFPVKSATLAIGGDNAVAPVATPPMSASVVYQLNDIDMCVRAPFNERAGGRGAALLFPDGQETQAELEQLVAGGKALHARDRKWFDGYAEVTLTAMYGVEQGRAALQAAQTLAGLKPISKPLVVTEAAVEVMVTPFVRIAQAHAADLGGRDAASLAIESLGDLVPADMIARAVETVTQRDALFAATAV